MPTSKRPALSLLVVSHGIALTPSHPPPLLSPFLPLARRMSGRALQPDAHQITRRDLKKSVCLLEKIQPANQHLSGPCRKQAVIEGFFFIFSFRGEPTILANCSIHNSLS